MENGVNGWMLSCMNRTCWIHTTVVLNAVCTMQAVVQRVWQPVVSCKRGISLTGAHDLLASETPRRPAECAHTGIVLPPHPLSNNVTFGDWHNQGCELGNFRRKISGNLFRIFRKFGNFLENFYLCQSVVSKSSIAKWWFKISIFLANNSPDV